VPVTGLWRATFWMWLEAAATNSYCYADVYLNGADQYAGNENVMASVWKSLRMSYVLHARAGDLLDFRVSCGQTLMVSNAAAEQPIAHFQLVSRG
jgi:hypothetical protein